MYRWHGLASKHIRHAIAAEACLKSCSRALKSSWLPLKGANSSSSASFLPIFNNPHMQFATRSGGRRPPPKDEDDDDQDDDDDDEDEFNDDVADNSGYEWDYETWNLLHQGKKENEKSRRWPLPMYKAREMVDYHMIKNRLDGLKVITDPKLEYELRKSLHEGLVEFYRKIQVAFDEIDAEQTKEQEKVEGGEDEKTLQIAADETISEGTEEQKSSVEGVAMEGEAVRESLQTELKENENEAQSHQEVEAAAPATLEAGEDVLAEASSVELTDLSAMTSALDDVINDVLTVPELAGNDSEKAVMEAKTQEPVADDEVNVFNYDKWVAYREQEMAKRTEEQKKHATLRWKIQLVLGPGDVWHPANRKATVSVYVRELGLSKYAKQRLLALVGKRYKSPKDELTIVSERYQHRYENQKDVLRTLLDLIEEAKKADQFVNDARIDFVKSTNSASKAPETGTAASQISA